MSCLLESEQPLDSFDQNTVEVMLGLVNPISKFQGLEYLLLEPWELPRKTLIFLMEREEVGHQLCTTQVVVI